MARKISQDNSDLTILDVHRIIYNNFPGYSLTPLKKNDLGFKIHSKSRTDLHVYMLGGSKEKSIYIEPIVPFKDIIMGSILPIFYFFLAIINFVLKIFGKKGNNTKKSKSVSKIEREVFDFLKQFDFSKLPETYERNKSIST